MTRSSDIHDTQVDRLFLGGTSADEAELGVAQFLHGLDRVLPVEPTAQFEAAHVAAMMAAAQATAEAGDLTTAPAPIRASTQPIWANLFGARWAKIAWVSAAALLALGSTAYAGVLPSPIQNAVSSFVQPIGITLPTSIHARGVQINAVEPTSKDAHDAQGTGLSGPRAPGAAQGRHLGVQQNRDGGLGANGGAAQSGTKAYLPGRAGLVHKKRLATQAGAKPRTRHGAKKSGSAPHYSIRSSGTWANTRLIKRGVKHRTKAKAKELRSPDSFSGNVHKRSKLNRQGD